MHLQTSDNSAPYTSFLSKNQNDKLSALRRGDPPSLLPHRTTCSPPVGAGFYPARSITNELLATLRRGRCPHRPARRHFLQPTVGATLAVARPLHSLQKPCHCEASAHTGCGNPYPRPIRRGRRPRRPAQPCTAPLVSVRRGPPEPALYRTPCKKTCHCEPVTDSLAVAIRTPVPLAPLPKGGWHGKAVTGGFRPPS